MLEQLKSYFKRTINWNKYDQKVSVQQSNPYLDFLINPSFQGVNIHLIVYPKYHVSTIEIKDKMLW